ncbi:hypothetical protein KP509_15G044300 [Ceratopteris richardii]|uniref:Uncharacterized protein n=2 Tax=Ceratopteris richardii TaxID=49495 RepID=A0A8T2T2W7_CERRI|nr:hypothetical protein KP509_15G044300 [Ceratopteris richardii]
MRTPVLNGIDLAAATVHSSPSLESTGPNQVNGKSFSRLRSKKREEVVPDDVLDEDLNYTPLSDAITPMRRCLTKTKRTFSDLEGSAQKLNDGEDVEMMSERRRALFEPLAPNYVKSIDSFLPPPDFETASYPRGWVIGKKRKLVNVDVVESMRLIAVQEMNRKDREINGLNEQLEEDARTMELLQMELQKERQKRLQAEREKATLQAQADMLMTMLNELEEETEPEPLDDCQVINN